MLFSWKDDSKTILVVCLASLLMALNINTFVQTGGLYPGGATGLANTGEPRRESSAATIAVFKPGTRHTSGQSGTTEPKRP